jgi:hypothetical protein
MFNQQTPIKKESNKLTIEELKSYPGFENVEKKEAEEIIRNVELYCEIVIQLEVEKE